MIATTGDYERLVPFFVANDLEFPDEEDYEVPTDLVQCWKVTEGAQPEPDEDSAEYKTDRHRLIGGFVLAERQGEFIVDGIAVDPEYRKEKLGKALLDLGIAETRKRGGKRIFLVARAPGFFRKSGFVTGAAGGSTKLLRVPHLPAVRSGLPPGSDAAGSVRRADCNNTGIIGLLH